MTMNFIISFLLVLPIAILGNFARSSRLPKQQRHIRADLLESVGLALGISLGEQGSALIPQWYSIVSFILLFIAGYFPICFLADWFRRRSRRAA